MKKYGICNICNNSTYLSGDHVPPKVVGNKGRCFSYSISNYINHMNNGKIENDINYRPYLNQQDGHKIYSICHKCNNIMGSRCDKELGKLMVECKKSIEHYTKKYEHLLFPFVASKKTKIQINTQLVAKSIIGHMAAIGENCPQSSFRPLIRDLFEDNFDWSTIHSEWDLYYWPYIDNDIIIASDIGATTLEPKKDPVIYSIIKNFPLVFCLATKNNSILFSENEKYIYQNQNLFHHLNYCEMPIDWNSVPHQAKLLMPEEDGIKAFLLDKSKGFYIKKTPFIKI